MVLDGLYQIGTNLPLGLVFKIIIDIVVLACWGRSTCTCIYKTKAKIAPGGNCIVHTCIFHLFHDYKCPCTCIQYINSMCVKNTLTKQN